MSEADINQVLKIRARHRAMDRQHGSHPNMSTNEHVNVINASLRELGENVKAYKDGTDLRLAELQANLQHVEQVVAKADVMGGAGSFEAGPRIGGSAVEALASDHNFTMAADQAQRRGKLSQFTARVNVDGSFRAALTSEGMGQVGDTSLPGSPERRGLAGQVYRPLRLLDVLPIRRTDSDSVEFVQINATGDAATQIKEGDSKAELDISGVARRAEIETIAGWVTASTQVLSDQTALAQQIDSVIRNKVLAKLEDAILNGTGGPGRIDGLLSQATALTPAIGATAADILGEALMLQTTNGYRPGLVVMSPLDWFRLQIARNANDEYLFGSPTSPLSPSLWNARIVTPAGMPSGTALTIDPSFVNVLERWSLVVQVSNSHADFFVRNLLAILGELRAGLEVLDAGAVQKVTLPTV